MALNVRGIIEKNYKLFAKANLLLANQRAGIPTKRDLLKKNNITIMQESMFDKGSSFEEFIDKSIGEDLKSYYMTLPCFKEGVYELLLEDGGSLFHHYNFLRMEREGDVEKYYFEINSYEKFPNSAFNLTSHIIMTKSINVENLDMSDKVSVCEYGYEIYQKNDLSKSDLVQIINFGNDKRKGFQKAFLIAQKDGLDGDIKDAGGKKEYLSGLTSTFSLLNLFTNFTLLNNKLHTTRNSGSTAKVTYEPSGKPQPKVLYRTAGKIKFHSAEIPRCATEEVVRHYTCMSWQQRGHVRRYKSGKEVWIKPCVKRRQKSNNEPPIVKLNIV